MEQKKNLCAQIPLSLHTQVSEAREAAGQTTSEYITNLLIEYYNLKKDGGNLELNDQLRAVAEEKQEILERMQALEEDKSQWSLRASRQREMEAWLDQQPMCFTEYDDTITHKFIERITVVDAGTIQVKIRDVDEVISEGLC